MNKQKFYITRDSDCGLFLHELKPEWIGDVDFTIGDFCSNGDVLSLSMDMRLYPEVKKGECYEVELVIGQRIDFSKVS